MKKGLIITSILLLSAAAYLWIMLCAKNKQLAECKEKLSHEKIIHDTLYIKQNDTGVSKLTACHDCSAKETYGHTFADFEDVVDRYRDTRWNVINQSFRNSSTLTGMSKQDLDAYQDSRAIWFSLDSLKQFICTIEKYSNLLSPKPDTLGIRMYYGVYNSQKKRFPQRHTLFMVPTFKNAGSGNGITGNDFDPRYNYQTKIEPGMPFSILRTSNARALVLTADNNDPQMRANDGDLCPPCSKGCVHKTTDSN